MKMLKPMRSCGDRLHGVRPCRWLPRVVCYWYVWRRNWRYHLTGSRGHGIWVRSAEERDRQSVTRVLRTFDFERPLMKKRESAKAAGDARHLASVETETFSDLMSLVEHCAIRKYDDGDARETGWITVKVKGAAWVVQVKDPDTACSFEAIADTLDKALQTAALMLSCDEAPWEQDTFLAANKARKRKAG